MSKPVFYDPGRKRWRRVRRTLDVLALCVTILVAIFLYQLAKGGQVPGLSLPDQRRPYRPIVASSRERGKTAHPNRHRKTEKPPSSVVLNDEEGIRAAFYVNWDAASYASLKEYAHQIDLLFPEWLHVITPDGKLRGVTPANQLFDVIGSTGAVQSVDDRVIPLLHAEKAATEVFPLVNNYDPTTGKWLTNVGDLLNNPASRKTFEQQLTSFVSAGNFPGVSLDLEEIPSDAQPGLRALVSELDAALRPARRIYINVPVDDDDFDYKYLAAHTDGLILMLYDQHQSESLPGPIAAQDWYITNLRRAAQTVPKEKIICALGNYGYDWTTSAPKKRGAKRTVDNVVNVSVQEAWLASQDSESPVEFDSDSMNPHYAYEDEQNQRHDVWFLDSATALNQMRAAREFGLNTFALWRLGAEDRSLWTIWDQPFKTDAQKLAELPPGQDVDYEGAGEIIRVTGTPKPGVRKITEDSKTRLITDEEITTYPTPYQVTQYGAAKNKIAISFDDGPDPTWTPKILDVLKQKNVHATFMVIGAQAQKHVGLLRRVYDEGHEIGNHTFTHPDISEISQRRVRWELNATELLFKSKLGVQPLYFRPPYSIDQEPDTDDEVRPLEEIENLNYIIVGDKLDPDDWKNDPAPTPQQEVDSVLSQINHRPGCDTAPCGNVVLLHDGGGDRSHTVRALPMLIDALREHGYQVVPVSELLGKTRDQVMPPISSGERMQAFADSLAFSIWSVIYTGIVVIFFVGDVLMTARLLFVGALAIYDRFHNSMPANAAGHSRPHVAVLVPSYNEEKVIERTVRSVLASDYPNLRVIVIDDGSQDRTYDVAMQAFASEIEAGKVVVLTKPNGGKAEALNYGLQFVTEEIYVGIDADTIIERHAISRLMPHFEDPDVAAVAGNAKVGNKVNIWTRWQALEYITSQNFERRALNVFGAVTVVPGALGAWRTERVREAGMYHTDTVAEDADLTMNLLERGYKVVYEDLALAFTEAPTNANGLMRQRFRWSFGILQAVWKRRQLFGRGGTLGRVALPNILIFQILLPLVSPFIDVMFVFGFVTYLLDRHFHPETANPRDLEKLVLFFGAFMVIDFVASSIAFALERIEGANQKRDGWLLGHIWLQRFAYRQLFSWILFRTLKRAFEGRPFAWDKLERKANVNVAG
ncbi:MAG TPA: glycosyltransferase [Terriglobales bacterium]|jgi:cellulose synthase/poly-beta-1,6-N-acetylglucosamine synthase-like glycosyltransferase/peptidoglycan/xylan/chitin deacetylase (PgdA/CDA1 family)/spore germination protein YaaH